MTFPAAVPEIPVASIDKAVAYYVKMLGFTHDWGYEKDGDIAGISRGDCRLFITSAAFRESHRNAAPLLFWNKNASNQSAGPPVIRPSRLRRSHRRICECWIK